MVKRILMVDDDADDRKIFHEIIHNLDASLEVVLATSAPEALKLLLLPPKPDLIFLDLLMPGMDGIECLTKMKANKRTGRIPVILYTSSENAMERKLAMRLGVFDIVIKTSNLENLTNRIRQLVSLEHHH
jgi:CheY-like chemotaxis protein